MQDFNRLNCYYNAYNKYEIKSYFGGFLPPGKE